MARASTPTLLSLDRFASIIGLSPAHFNQAYASSISPAVFPLRNACSDVWFQYDWQKSDRISRESLASIIDQSERELEAYLGFSPAPRYYAREMHQYPRPYYREAVAGGLNQRGQFKSLSARSARFIAAGRRATSLIATATTAAGTLVYSDADSDGLEETATITVPSTLSDKCEACVYFASHAADPAWEIRPPRSVTLSGGVLTLTFWSWQLLSSSLWETLPTDNDTPAAIDISTTANYVTSVDVYREYTDFSQASAQFYWEKQPSVFTLSTCPTCNGDGCEACALTTQTGCLHARDIMQGIVVPQPADYDSDTATWALAAWDDCREPDQVRIWYRAGDVSDRYLADQSCDPLADFYARAIAYMTIARLERPFCQCGNVIALQENLRVDLAQNVSGASGSQSYQNTPDLLDCPFGTHRGEWLAWQAIRRNNPSPRRARVAVI